MFGNRLKELRISNGMSMDALVELYNKKFGGKLNKSTISRYENGLQDPLYTVVSNFADLFDVTADYLINDKHNNVLTESEQQMLDLYSQLYIEDQAEIRGEIKQMLKADKYSDEERAKYRARQFEIAAFGGGIMQSRDDDFETTD